jgi:hypothetical protein
MGWATVAEVIAIVVVLAVVLPLLWVVLRRRLLARLGGTFDCSLRVPEATPGTGWMLGVARYAGEYLEWYAAFGFGLKPRLRLERAWTMAVEQRVPSTLESVALYDHRRIVLLEQRRTSREPRELAMTEESLTGLLAWLEAAPPGLGRYGNVDSAPRD